ncbi:MAG: purine-nucleoside phosphorylase [Campylobacter hyointestinalis]
MIVCAGLNESFEFALPIGVGITSSAINLTKILTANKADEIIFVGTCGLYKDGNLLDIYESKTAVNLEISSLLRLSYSPLFSSPIVQDLKNVSCETLITNSSNFITTNIDIAHKFSELGLFMENMELYSVLETAKQFKIPARGILCATNFCEPNAHNEFIKNHKKAKINLEKYLKERDII